MSMKGKTHSEETKKKISEKAKGNKAFSGRKHSEDTRKKISESAKKTFQNGRVSFFQGKRPPNQPPHLSLDTKLKISEKLRGEKNHRWKGGISSTADKVRNSFEYKLWRDEVFKRDNNQCVICGIKGERNSVYLIADHIKSFHYFPELRMEVSNGRVLCRNCHCQTDTYGGNVHKLEL